MRQSTSNVYHRVFTFLLQACIGVFITIIIHTSAYAEPIDEASGGELPAVSQDALQINITDAGLSPSFVTVRPGSMVTWHNTTQKIQQIQGGNPHYLFLPFAAGDRTDRISEGLVKTNLQTVPLLLNNFPFTATIPINGSFSYTFTETGTYSYFIATQPSLAGTVETDEVVIKIVEPISHALVADELPITVTVGSQYELSEVKAYVDSREVNLTRYGRAFCDSYGCDTGWNGVLSLSGLPRNAYTLTVVATDLVSHTAEVHQQFIHDTKPNIEILSPLPSAVAQPTLRIVAQCQDDDPQGCSSFTVSLIGPNYNTEIISSEVSIDQVISLDTHIGESATLRFTAYDSVGQSTFQERKVYIDSSSHFTPVVSVSGEIWDVHVDRILFLDQLDKSDILKIYDRDSGQEIVVISDTSKIPQYGYLTPKGAIFVAQSGDVTTASVYDFRDGILVNLGQPDSTNSLRVTGNYAIWNSRFTLFLRDLVVGTNQIVSTNAGNWKNDVANNGDVVYWGYPGYAIYRFRSGTTTQLTFDDSTLWNTYVRADEINAVYRKHAPCCSNQLYKIVVYGASGEEILAEERTQEPLPDRDYQVNNGWIAFTDLGRQGQFHVWLRSLNGQKNTITSFPSSSIIDSLAPNGEIMFFNQNRRYLGRLNKDVVSINTSLGKAFWQDGYWFIQIGNSVFQVSP